MRAYRSVFDTSTLSFVRQGSGTGYLGADGVWVETPITPVEAIGDLQPIPAGGLKQLALPEGYTSEGAYMFSSKATLQTVQDSTATSCDTTTIGARQFYVAMTSDWSQGPLSTDYNTYILAQQSLPNEGAIV